MEGRASVDYGTIRAVGLDEGEGETSGATFWVDASRSVPSGGVFVEWAEGVVILEYEAPANVQPGEALITVESTYKTDQHYVATRRLLISTAPQSSFPPWLPALLATAGASTPLSAVLLIAVILFGFQTAIGNIQTLPSDFFSGKSVGSLAGVGGTAAVAGTLITTELIPRITEVSFAPAFILGAALVPLAIVSVWVFGGRIRPLAAEN